MLTVTQSANLAALQQPSQQAFSVSSTRWEHSGASQARACVADAEPRAPRGLRMEAWMQPNDRIPTPSPPQAGMPPGQPTLPSFFLLPTLPAPRTTRTPAEFSWRMSGIAQMLLLVSANSTSADARLTVGILVSALVPLGRRKRLASAQSAPGVAPPVLQTVMTSWIDCTNAFYIGEDCLEAAVGAESCCLSS